MAKPNSRQTLIDYCLRSLGAPVVEINVDEDQIDDRVDEALQYYQQYHRDAIEKIYLKHQITQADIDNGYVAINDLITEVVRVFPLNDSNASTDDALFDIDYQLHLEDVYNLGYTGSLVDYVMSKQYLTLIDMVIDADNKHISFKKHMNQLRIDMDWSKEVSVDEYIVIECYRIIDPTTYTDVYNDYYLKRYLTALIKFQWGTNLSKFEGMQMPGGITFNGRQILDDAREEIRQLEEEVRLNWEEPMGIYTA